MLIFLSVTFYYLEDTAPNEHGLIIFDEIEKSDD
jgi:hypothetical protein